MLYNTLLSLTAFMFCLSLFLVHRASVLQSDFLKLQGDIILQLNQQHSEGVDGKMATMSKTGEDMKPSVFQRAQSSLKISSRRVKREQSSCRPSTSFLQLRANTNKQPDIRGNITVIPWTVSAQQGNTISQKENRIVVQEDGYYLVFGQVLFESPSAVMGHVIQSWSSTKARKQSRELLRCLQEMPDETPANTCYTAGTVQLLQGDELELVIPCRPTALISMEADSTFFGVIQLN
ncbi:tumor necrosis factor ligand superfamily member 13B-like isoform X2 [Melanotaenia boesemani]|uniref:tumor necrosis factor ligand superfamily member 13B-like isoform X2 n=1 Tax=Melanotaenia boesemani TaxID=1250792 RepID=UPI001C05C4A1|nr:tumor necrosis factor ligand superfamily member 13B-like isoform X2 [Melanotaenia boesemani]